MGDIRALSDAQLLALAGQAAPAPQAAPRPAPQQRQADGGQRSAQPRGIRNNNPGNIEDGPFARTLPGYQGSDGRFAIFADPQAGQQAQVRLLQSYGSRGFDTPAAIINRWAPPSDNNPTQEYAAYVAQRLGVAPDERLNLSDPQVASQVAAAIGEFENGQRVPMGDNRPVAAGLSGMSDEDLLRMAGQAPPEEEQEFEITSGVQNINGRAVMLGQGDNPDMDYGPWEDYLANGPGTPLPLYTPQYREALRQARAGSENVPDQLRALTQGGSYGLGDEVVGIASAADQGLTNLVRRLRGEEIDVSAGDAARAARQAEREAQSEFASRNPAQNFGLQLAGGLLAPGTVQGARLINAGTGTARLGRAAAVSGAQGAAFGMGNAEGGLLERAPDTAVGGLLGGTTGLLLQGGADRLARSAANARNNPSAARLLSQQGINLTPGQMMGGAAQRIEDGAMSIPLLGDGIRGARIRGIEDFNRVAIDEALQPLGTRLEGGVRREGIREMGDKISQAYNRALEPVTLARDEAVENALEAVREGRNLSAPLRRDLRNVLDDILERTSEGPITGDAWKQIDSELAAAVRAADTAAASNPASRTLRTRLQEARDAWFDLLERNYPEAADLVAAADEATVDRMRIEAAAGSVGAREGLFTPAQMNSATRQQSGRRRFARGEGRSQESLTDPAMAVLPSTVPDSGTPFRGLLAGGAGAAAVTQPVATGAVVTGLLAGGAVYSKPVQTALNAIYRASNPGQTRQALARLAEMARADPALQPVYQEALRHVRGDAPSPTPAMPQEPRGLLSATGR